MPSSIKIPNLGIRIVCKVAERIIFLTTSIRALKGSADPAAGPRTSWSVQGDKIFRSFPECLCQDILLLMRMSSCPDLTMIQKLLQELRKSSGRFPGELSACQQVGASCPSPPLSQLSTSAPSLSTDRKYSQPPGLVALIAETRRSPPG